MKTLRGSFYGVTKAFVCLKNICILHAPIMVLSDRCQTHQSCAFLCALSNGVYCTMQSSGSLCLHVCPWWEYNISGWFVSLLAENTRLSQKTMCHNPSYFTVTDWIQMQNFLVWILPQKKKKLNTSSIGLLLVSNKHVQFQPWPQHWEAISGWSAARTVKSLIVTCTVRFNKRSQERHGWSDSPLAHFSTGTTSPQCQSHVHIASNFSRMLLSQL